MKTSLTTFFTKIMQFCRSLCSFLIYLQSSSQHLARLFLRTLLLKVGRFWLQLCYFVTLFMFGYFILAFLEPRNPGHQPGNFDLLFTSVSAVTVSSMSTVEMEVFSNSQLFCLAILMLLGGEVFTSILELQFNKFKLLEKNESQVETNLEDGLNPSKNDFNLKYKSMKFLGFIVISYFVTVQVTGFLLVSMYVGLVQSAEQVLRNKNINIQVFSIVTTISTFTNCGFLPTNEGMMVFKKNLGLLIILIPLVLLGNTLYPVFLRMIVTVLRKMRNREELNFVMNNQDELGYCHLLSGVDCGYLALTSFGFIMVQFAVFIPIGWKSKALDELNPLEKVVGSLFQVVNTRHTGESVFDLSLVSPAIIVLIVTLMYLPAYTYFLPRDDNEEKVKISYIKKKRKTKKSRGFLILSPLPFLVVIIMLLCITQSENMKKDPLNFSVLNIIFEVISDM
ncbi:sodium transporter HKT1-like isoform X2 [Rutidosis leptorrhynchoides]|uniref:sodium transporter HKT1-like isoform X2 n=1 Tax=Rutidosis leptorrhynchoides TaxID=125765 RepID=UPI003A99EE47